MLRGGKKLDGHNAYHFLLDKLDESKRETSRTTLFPDIREICSFP